MADAEGFEAIGSSNAEGFFAVLPILEKSADPKAVELWKWHLAEEFEHRHVCFDVYRTLFGKGPLRGYFYRCYGYRSEEHTSELQSLMRISYAVFCLKKKTNNTKN